MCVYSNWSDLKYLITSSKEMENNIILTKYYIKRQETMSICRFIVGPPSSTFAQRKSNIYSTSPVFLVTAARLILLPRGAAARRLHLSRRHYTRRT